jgi:hypothetical protein
MLGAESSDSSSLGAKKSMRSLTGGVRAKSILPLTKRVKEKQQPNLKVKQTK